MRNIIPIDNVVKVKGVIEPGFILGWHQNFYYIVGWNKQPTFESGQPTFTGLATVVYYDHVTDLGPP